MVESHYNLLSIIPTSRIVELVVNLLDGTINPSAAKSEAIKMASQIREELDFYSTNGEEGQLVISAPKEWQIHNAAKAETRGAILEGLLKHIENGMQDPNQT